MCGLFARLYQWSGCPCGPARADDWRGHEVIPGGGHGVDQGGCGLMVILLVSIV